MIKTQIPFFPACRPSGSEMMHKPLMTKLSPIKITIIYASFACLWILFSDYMLAIFAYDSGMMRQLQTVKGWFFVIVTAALLYMLTKRHTSEIITSGEKIQHRLRDSEQRFRAAFDSAPTGMDLLSTSGNYFKVNESFCSMLGHSRKALNNTSWIEFTHPDDIQISEEQIRKLESDGQAPQIEKRYIRKGGDILWALVSAAAIYMDEKTPQYYLIQIVDITQRKQAMEELKESETRYRILSDYAGDPVFVHDFDLNIQMGHLVFETDYFLKNGDKIPVEASISEIDFIHQPAVLTIARDITERRQAEKLQGQLQQAQKMQAIGTLAGGIAHDFNNILFPIIGYTEMAILDIAEASRAKGYLRQVLEATSRAKDLVQQILTFSRSHEEKLKPVKVQPIVKETLKLCRSTFPSTIDIRKNIDPDCGLIMGDPTRIHQVVMNLCTNAYQAMSETGGILEVKLDEATLTAQDIIDHISLPPGRYVHLSVADTGPGIAPFRIKKIFEPYFTTKTSGEGTGLGLAVTQGIVKNLQGDITVFSTPGEGSVFHIYLPRIEVGPPEDKKIPKKSLPPGGSEHLLVVDDKIQLLQMEQLILTRLGYRITTISNGIDALAAFEKNPAFEPIY